LAFEHAGDHEPGMFRIHVGRSVADLRLFADISVR
jgi:hypothetical protein